MDNKNVSENISWAENSLNIVNGWISNVDTKVSYALIISGILAGFVFSQGKPIVLDNIIIFSICSKVQRISVVAGIILFFLALMFISATIILFLLAISCRVKSKEVNSRLFFGRIANYDLPDFINMFKNQNDVDYLVSLLTEIHTNSVICKKKIRLYNLGIKFLVISFLFFLMYFGITITMF